MRNGSRRSFTVEVRGDGRRKTTIIPTRVAAVPVPSPRAFLALPPEPSTSVAEKRRILPSLIVAGVQQAEAALTLDADDVGSKRRERIRKRPLAPAEPSTVEPSTVEPDVAGLLVAAAEMPRPAPAATRQVRGEEQPPRGPRRRAKAKALAPGERWKRRLGRWNR